MIGTAMSCVECQRRKQKCSRVFPCNHCVKRGVSHLCRFPQPKVSAIKSEASSTEQLSYDTKRPLQPDDDEISYQDISLDNFDATHALTSLGYAPGNAWMGALSNTPKSSKDTGGHWESLLEVEMREALREMPPKPYTDCLVDNWLSGANHHYYALYPSEFRAQYDGWWANRQAREEVSLVFTSLILRVCASSAQFLPIDNIVRSRLETDLNEDAQAFSKRLHKAAVRLNASIPPGQGGLVQVQQLFLTAYWFKSEEEWVESWHALAEAVAVAYEIGLHQDWASDGLSEYDREMRRRLWALLYMWDFAMSSLLGRPILVNMKECNFLLPTLSLENDPRTPGLPSPFFHINMHCQLCLNISSAMDCVAGGLVPLSVTMAIRDEVDRWFQNLPPVYALRNPETKWDQDNPWIIFQRRYLHMIGFMTVFHPLKPYLTRDSSGPMNDEDRQLRESGVAAALKLMEVAERFYENLYPTAPRFHYAVFCIFDTSTVLSSALVHDTGRNLPMREKLFNVVKKGLKMLESLNSLAGTTETLCRLLRNLILQLRFSDLGAVVAKRAKIRFNSPEEMTQHGPTILEPADNGSSGQLSAVPLKRSSSAADDCDSATLSNGGSTPNGCGQDKGLSSDNLPLQNPPDPVSFRAISSPGPATFQSVASLQYSQVVAGRGEIVDLKDAIARTPDTAPGKLASYVNADLDHNGVPNVGDPFGPMDSSLDRELKIFEFSSVLDSRPCGTSPYHVGSGSNNGLLNGTPAVGLQTAPGGGFDGSTISAFGSSPNGHQPGSYLDSPGTSSALDSNGTNGTFSSYQPDAGTYALLEDDSGACLIPEPSSNVNIFAGDGLNLEHGSYRAIAQVWDWRSLDFGTYPYADRDQRGA